LQAQAQAQTMQMMQMVQCLIDSLLVYFTVGLLFRGVNFGNTLWVMSVKPANWIN